MLATLCLAAALAQEAPPPRDAGWEHVLVRHETYEDFYAGGASSGVGVRLSTQGPLELMSRACYAREGGSSSLENSESDLEYFERSDTEVMVRRRCFVSAPVAVDGGFDELLPSWNVDCPAGAGLRVELRVAAVDGLWSPWLDCGGWGAPPPRIAPVEFGDGRVDTDVFVGKRRLELAQYRVFGLFLDEDALTSIVVRRVTLCFSRRVEAREAKPFTPPREALRRIDVPYRSQKSEAPELASRICSPTSVAMLLGYRGVDVPTAEVAARLYDAEHDIYGNWNRAVQGAFSFGVPGFLARFGDWSAVAQLVAAGQPLVISIAVDAGGLDGAPYRATDGHLLVLTGFDEGGDVRVSDPAAADAARGETTYRREQLERAWMARGGTAYVLLPRPR